MLEFFLLSFGKFISKKGSVFIFGVLPRLFSPCHSTINPIKLQSENESFIAVVLSMESIFFGHFLHRNRYRKDIGDTSQILLTGSEGLMIKVWLGYFITATIQMSPEAYQNFFFISFILQFLLKHSAFLLIFSLFEIAMKKIKLI